jgi:hypothetical protein
MTEVVQVRMCSGAMSVPVPMGITADTAGTESIAAISAVHEIAVEGGGATPFVAITLRRDVLTCAVSFRSNARTVELWDPQRKAPLITLEAQAATPEASTFVVAFEDVVQLAAGGPHDESPAVLLIKGFRRKPAGVLTLADMTLTITTLNPTDEAPSVTEEQPECDASVETRRIIAALQQSIAMGFSGLHRTVSELRVRVDAMDARLTAIENRMSPG